MLFLRIIKNKSGLYTLNAKKGCLFLNIDHKPIHYYTFPCRLSLFWLPDIKYFFINTGAPTSH